MIPLNFADVGEENIIKKVGGKPEVKKHLENLGFVVGANVEIVSTVNGNLIVKVKESRVALSIEMAQKIMVWSSLKILNKGEQIWTLLKAQRLAKQ